MNVITGSKLRAFCFVLPLFLGVISFLIVVGPRVLNPLNIAWIGAEDSATSYLGWLFFRDSSWGFPIGLNPRYGLEIGNAILYSDSNPLFAFIFKPFSPLLPHPFQYFGIWLLICFILQAWFAWKLLGLIENDVLIRLFGAGIFVFSPPMIWRVGGHFSLVGHFLILVALYLSFSGSRLEWRRIAWCSLLAVTALVHAYLLAMAALIWFADSSGGVFRKESSLRDLATESTMVLVVTALVCWQAGYFSVGAGTSSGGFGLYRMNLLSMLDSSGWSYVLKDIPGPYGDYEGFNYLGLGVIFLLVVSMPLLMSGRVDFVKVLGKNLHLVVAFSGLAVVSVSNNVGLGWFEYKYPLPDFLMNIANIFRASGRMFWPVFYVIVFASIWFVVRGFGTRISSVLLGLALVIQVVDTSAGWSGFHKALNTAPGAKWDTTLTDPFWLDAASRYKNIRYIPVGNHSAEWSTLAYYAGTNGLGTDSIYLARVGALAIKNAQRKASEAVQFGNFEQNSLYVLDDKSFLGAALVVDRNDTLLARIDGFNVVAPGWNSCADCRRIVSDMKIGDLLPSLQVGDRISFNESSIGLKYLLRGWSAPEAWGAWSDGAFAAILLPIPPQQATSVFFEANALVSLSHSKQHLGVSINGIPVTTLTVTEPSVAFEIKIPEAVKRNLDTEYLKFEFHFPDAARPKDIGLGDDRRNLALGLIALTVR